MAVPEANERFTNWSRHDDKWQDRCSGLPL